MGPLLTGEIHGLGHPLHTWLWSLPRSSCNAAAASARPCRKAFAPVCAAARSLYASAGGTPCSSHCWYLFMVSMRESEQQTLVL